MSWAIASALAFVSIAFILAYIAFKMDEENNGLRLFFLFISIYFLLLAAANGIYIVEESGVSAVSIDKMTNVVSLSYKILNILIYFAGAFFLFMYFYKIANWMASHAKK